MMKKKAQEEMVGFVMIMVVVAVIFLIFLGIFIRKPPADKADSEEISQFLDSVLEYTTNCSIDTTGYIKLKFEELVKECYNTGGKLCDFSSDTVCDETDKTIKDLIGSSWRFSLDSPEKGYEFRINKPDGTDLRYIPSPSACGPLSTRGAEKIISVPDGGITLSLKICLT